MSEYRICQRCVMDSTIPGIIFYEDGTCSYCREYERRRTLENLPDSKKKERLSSLVTQIKHAGRGKEFDAIIGLSGGLDSTFAAYVSKSLGLNLLGVHVDNGWNTEFAEKNIRALAERLEIPLIIERIPFEEFRDLQIAFLRASVINAEIPTDNVIAAVLYRVADHKTIRYLINGGNFATEGFTISAFGHYNRDLRYVHAIHRRFGTRPLRNLPLIGVSKTLYYRYVRGIKVIRILNYVDYRREEAVEILRKEIGWCPYEGKHNESIYTRFFQSYILPEKFGLDKRRVHLSALICSGQLRREEALKQLAQPPYPNRDMLEHDKRKVLEGLGISEEEFEEIMQLPVRSDRDFPSLRWLFDFGGWLARHGLRLGE